MNIGTTVDTRISDTHTRDALEDMTSGIMAGWLVEHQLDGTHNAPVDLAMAPALFSTEHGMNDLTIGTSQVGVTWSYVVRGAVMWMQLLVRGCTVANTPAEFRVRLPAPWMAKVTAVVGSGWASDNGTVHNDVLLSTRADTQYLLLTLASGANWANSAAGTSFGFTTTFRVRRQ